MKNRIILIIGGLIAIAVIAWLVYSDYTKNSTNQNANNYALINSNANNQNSEPISKVKAMCANLEEHTDIVDADARSANKNTIFNYHDNCLGFTLHFSPEIFKSQPVSDIPQKKISLPGPNGKQIEKTLYVLEHTINVQHCGLSGKCTPTTTDMSWSATARQETFNPKNYSNLDLKNVVYGNISAYEGSMGAEGEGIVYTFIPVHDGRDAQDAKPDYVIILYRTYIDENVITSYKTAKGFLPIKQQAEIYKNIIQSLTHD